MASYGQKTKTNTIKRNVIKHKINTHKTKAMFGRLLRHPAWKRRTSILKGRRCIKVTKKRKKRNKWGSLRYNQANKIYSAEITNRIKGALRPVARTRLTMRKQSQRLENELELVHLTNTQMNCTMYKHTATMPGSLGDRRWRGGLGAKHP